MILQPDRQSPDRPPEFPDASTNSQRHHVSWRSAFLTASSIAKEVQKTTADTKGDWRPLVFLMTDGSPNDDWRKGLNDFKAARTGVVVACAAGHDADTSVLKEITEIVVQLDTADSSTIKAFFKWVSASISVGSQKVESSKKK